MKRQTLKSLKLRNFKAVRDSKTIRFTPLTVFIGNNGSGKSSIIESLSTYQRIVINGLEDAMNYWLKFEYIRNQAVSHPPMSVNVERSYERNPIELNFRFHNYQVEMTVTTEPNGDLFIYGDLQPTLTSRLEIEPKVYLQLTESGFKIPGWLLSTGTLRILALLALLRHPNPAPLIVIEEIENGLDPRTIHLIIDEIRNVLEAGKTQVILTTHSPYLLDLLSLSQIVLVERDDIGQPILSRPADQESLQEWSKKYGPGKLYTMDRLGQKG